jgi:hypothetical protein
VQYFSTLLQQQGPRRQPTSHQDQDATPQKKTPRGTQNENLPVCNYCQERERKDNDTTKRANNTKKQQTNKHMKKLHDVDEIIKMNTKMIDDDNM